MKIASASVNCRNLATSKLLIALKLPLDNSESLAFVAPISPTRIFLAELDMWLFAAVCTENPNRHIVVMEVAEDSMGRSVSEPLNGAIGGCIFVSDRCVLILLYYSESLTQNDEVVEALASDRSDQPFGKAILPGRGWCDGF